MKKFSLYPAWLVVTLLMTATPCGILKLSAQEFTLNPLFEQYGLTIRDQGSRGTCSVFAIVGLLEFEYAHLLGKQVNLSVEYLNWASNQVTGEAEDGSFFSDALTGIRRFGVCEDSLFPYYTVNYTTKVAPSHAAIADGKKRKLAETIWIKEWDPNTGMSEEQIRQVKAQIRARHPVAIGFQWPKAEEKYRRTENGMMTVPPREGVFDGHSIIMTGYQDDPSVAGGGWFLFRNSHGIGYGDKGYGRMPYEYLRKYANDGVSLKVGRFAGQPDKILLSDLDSAKAVDVVGLADDSVSTWLITLDGKAITFCASACLPVMTPSECSAEYVVTGDRKILWRSGILKAGNTPRKVKVNVKGIRQLGLLIRNTGIEVFPVKPGWNNGVILYLGNVPFISDNRVGSEQI